MSAALPGAWRRSAPWLFLAVVAAAVLAMRLQVSFDISAFFPSDTRLEHEVLLEQFQNGPGSRLLVVGLSGANRETLAEASDALREVLADDAAFSAVLNGEFPDEAIAPPEPVASYYLLLRDLDYSEDALAAAVRERLQDLAFGGGSELLDLIARDPYLATLDVLERLAPAALTGEMWFAADGSAVLMLETRATAVDIAAQSAAIERIREAVGRLPGSGSLTLDITGPGAFGVELQRTIRAEAKKRSVLAGLALLAVLLLFYRRPRYLVLAALPIGMGFLVGLATVSLLFDSIHGITLAFGFTLMGVAIDYPLHLFSHAGSDANPVRSIWPTMRLGALSTAIAYLALAFSGSDGLAQLGVFTAAGILVAVLATRTWLPTLLGDTAVPVPAAGAAVPVALRYAPAVAVMVVSVVAVFARGAGGLWDDHLTSLSPVPAERLASDTRLRSAAGTPDMRYQLIVHESTLDGLLEKSERIDRRLDDAVNDGILDGYQSVSQLLPSAATQRSRQARIPAADTLAQRISAALQGLPFREDAFDAFLSNAGKAAGAPLLTADAISETPLKSWLESHLVAVGDGWAGMVSMSGPDVAALADRAPDWGDGVLLMDIRSASLQLMADYRNGALLTVSAAALIILVLLWYQRRKLLEVLWIAISVASVLMATVAAIVLLHGALTVIHLVALLLVLGLGLDYALFLSRCEKPHQRRATDQAVLACAVSTTLAFGLLAGSSIPVLRFLGLTVAAGSLLSYLIAFAGSRDLIRRAD